MRPTIYAAILNADSVKSWLIVFVGLAIIAAGLGVIVSAKKADYAQTARVSVNVLAGCALCALGAGVGVIAFGSQILDAFGIGK